MLIVYDADRLSLQSYSELFNHERIQLTDDRWLHRAPLVCHFNDAATGTDLLVMLNHLARGSEAMRQGQARGLLEWAKTKTLPIIAIGDYNFDYSFPTARGNESFNVFMRGGVWKWIKPEQLIDTNWADRDGDGKDDYPDSMLDFVFVANGARKWQARTRVVVRNGDFPDDAATSDHRPVECIIALPLP